MESAQFFEIFTGTAGVIVFVVVLLWILMSFFLPFMVYSIMQSNKRLIAINSKILTELQGSHSARRTNRSEPEK